MRLRAAILILFFLLFNICFGQVLKKYGYGVSIGNSLSPSGYFAINTQFNFFQNTELNWGFALVPAKTHIGIKQDFALNKHIELFLACKYTRLFSYATMVNENTSEERLYEYSAGNFLTPDIGINYLIPFKKEPSAYFVIWAGCGYSYSLSNYSIKPVYEQKYNEGEINEIRKSLFTNGLFFNLGVTIRGICKKK